jgi:hypothetical protein
MLKVKKSLRLVLIMVSVVGLVFMAGCRQSERVSYNLSLEADSFNVTRQLTVINTRAMDGNSAILFQMIGNFSITKADDGDLEVTGENPNGTYYKHFVNLSRDISYVVQDLGTTKVNKHKFEINYNPKMIVPVTVTKVD